MTYAQKLIIDKSGKRFEDITPEEIAVREAAAQEAAQTEAQEAARVQAVKGAYLRLKSSPNQDVQDVLVILKYLYSAIED